MGWKEEAFMIEKWMTVKDVADYFQMSKDQIYRLAQKARFQFLKLANVGDLKKIRSIIGWRLNICHHLNKPVLGINK